MFHHRAARRLLPSLLNRCQSFRHEGIRYSSTLTRRSTVRFAKESHSSNQNFFAAMICAASVVAVGYSDAANHNNINKTSTHTEGRFSAWFHRKSPKNKELVSHTNVTVWNKNGRTIYLLGARGYSTESATLAKQLVNSIHPQAVFVDIDEHVFVSYGMYDECKKALQDSANEMDFDFQGDVEVTLPAVPKDDISHDSSSSLVQSFFGGSNQVETAIQKMFAELKYAGIDETQPMASSGEHFVNAIVEGHKNGATLVLGGRNYDVTKARTDEAMANTSVSAADVPLDLTWRPDETDRENYRSIRNTMQRVFPIFFQVVGIELDEHIATKLNKLDTYPSIVAVVMMLHIDGVEESLKSKGWQQED